MPAETRAGQGQGHQQKGHHGRHGHPAKGQGQGRPGAAPAANSKRGDPRRPPSSSSTSSGRKTTTMTTTLKGSKNGSTSKEVTSRGSEVTQGGPEMDRLSLNDNENEVFAMETGEDEEEKARAQSRQQGESDERRQDDDDDDEKEDRSGRRKKEEEEERKSKFDHSDDEDAFKGEYMLHIDRRHGHDVTRDVNANGNRNDNARGVTMARSNLDVRTFNANLDEFVTQLQDARFHNVGGVYPVDDLISVISMVSANIEEYREHTQQTQQQLNNLRSAMKTVRENLHLSITRQAFELNADEETETEKTDEELELRAKLARLNQTIAETHQDVAEASKLTAVAEHFSIKANIAAEQARLETQRIQEELALREELERQRKEDYERNFVENERKRLEEEKRDREERARKEEERKRKEEQRTGYRSHEEREAMESWPPIVYTTTNSFPLDPNSSTSGGEVICIVRGNPYNFKRDEVTCSFIDQNDISVAYGDQDELISKVMVMESNTQQRAHPIEALYVAVAFNIRLPSSREAVVLAKRENGWEHLVTNEVQYEGFKEYKFAQARLLTYTTLVVMSRFKKEYQEIWPSKKPVKITSSYDQRVTLTIPKGLFKDKDELFMQVQPVDTATVGELRTSGEPRNKSLLTSSPILHTEWTVPKFKVPVTITLPCPPNPAKARKMAAVKKQKEEKMKVGPPKAAPPPEEKPKKAAAKAQTEGDEQEAQPASRQVTRWYMGQYGQTDDDENDRLCFIGVVGGKYVYVPDVNVITTKIDMVAFDIETAYDKLMVLRVRPDIEDDQLKLLAQDLNQQLAHRSIRVIVKQKLDDPYDVCVQVVPTVMIERAERTLKDENYVVGSDKYVGANIKEGDTLVIQLRGNLRFRDKDVENKSVPLIFNSNLQNKLTFHVGEVDRYLQKTFDSFRGAVRVQRQFYVMPTKTLVRPGEAPPQPILKHTIICDVDVDIPKSHIQPDPIPMRVPLVLHDCGSVDAELMMGLSTELGEEWTRLANKLNIDHVRIQSILRQVEAKDPDDDRAKFEMLMTWMKRCPQAADKVAVLGAALESVNRHDLVTMVKLGRRNSATSTPKGTDPTHAKITKKPRVK